MREKSKALKARWALTAQLAKNDFKKRYAGSYLGRIWAMAQPLVTLLLYYLVFEKIFAARGPVLASGLSVPYALFLTGGLLPWFFFSEAMGQGTVALSEYSYLVKKVVFSIEILPLVKLAAAAISHGIFVLLALAVSGLFGHRPAIYVLQLPYYFLGLFVFSLGLAYLLSALQVFVRDVAQIVSIGLQIGMWATPILWQPGAVGGWAGRILMANPLAYITEGYRNALYGGRWFWEQPAWAGYFWLWALGMLALGRWVFARCRPHFADVL